MRSYTFTRCHITSNSTPISTRPFLLLAPFRHPDTKREHSFKLIFDCKKKVCSGLKLTTQSQYGPSRTLRKVRPRENDYHRNTQRKADHTNWRTTTSSSRYVLGNQSSTRAKISSTVGGQAQEQIPPKEIAATRKPRIHWQQTPTTATVVRSSCTKSRHTPSNSSYISWFTTTGHIVSMVWRQMGIMIWVHIGMTWTHTAP